MPLRALVSSSGKNGVILALGDATILPFIGQLLAGADSHETLVDPFTGIAFTLISCDEPLGDKLGIKSFFDTLSADLGKPELEWLSLFGRYRLDDAKKLLGVGDVSETAFAIRGL